MLFTEMTEEAARDLAREDRYEVGLEQGLEQGRRTEKKMIARNLKASGIALDEIIKVTGVTKEELETL